jgi:hypothetical protein
MNNPNIKTKVIQSDSKDQWNIICTTLGKKYKIAVIPYVYNDFAKSEAFQHAVFISNCFNSSDLICESLNEQK